MPTGTELDKILIEQYIEEKKEMQLHKNEESKEEGHCLIEDFIYQTIVTPHSDLDDWNQPSHSSLGILISEKQL